MRATLQQPSSCSTAQQALCLCGQASCRQVRGVAAAINVAMPRRLSLPSSASACPAYDKYASSCIAGGGCPFHAASAGALPARGTFGTAAVPAALRNNIAAKRPVQQLSPFAGSPMASLSLSFGLPVGVTSVATRVMPPMCLQECYTDYCRPPTLPDSALYFMAHGLGRVVIRDPALAAVGHRRLVGAAQTSAAAGQAAAPAAAAAAASGRG
jgi:hypothetical protein